MPFLHKQRLQDPTIAANKNDNETAGPACSAATTPGKVKIDVETIVPTPSARKSRTRSACLRCHLYFDK